jgi:hypothetical protein
LKLSVPATPPMIWLAATHTPQCGHAEILGCLGNFKVRDHRLNIDPAAFRMRFRNDVSVKRRYRRMSGVRRKLPIKNVSFFEVIPDLGNMFQRKCLCLLELPIHTLQIRSQPLGHVVFELNVGAENFLAARAAVAHFIVSHFADECLAFFGQSYDPVEILENAPRDRPRLDYTLGIEKQEGSLRWILCGPTKSAPKPFHLQTHAQS